MGGGKSKHPKKERECEAAKRHNDMRALRQGPGGPQRGKSKRRRRTQRGKSRRRERDPAS